MLGATLARWLEHARERSRLTQHLVKHTQCAIVAWPTSSAQRLTDGKVLSHSIVATPRTGQARKCGWQGIGAGRRRGGGSHRCAAAALGGSSGRGSRPRLGKLLQGGWVLRDLPRKKGGGWLGLTMVSRSWKQGRSGGILSGGQRSQRRGQNARKEGSICTRMAAGRMGQQRWQHACAGRWDSSALRRGGARTHTTDAARVPAAVTSREGYAKWTFSIRCCPG
jgi:hypothetical protein